MSVHHLNDEEARASLTPKIHLRSPQKTTKTELCGEYEKINISVKKRFINQQQNYAVKKYNINKTKHIKRIDMK